MEIKQGSSFKVPVKLVLSTDSSEKTGVAFGDVTCWVHKQGAAAASKAILVTDWAEVSSAHFPGVYDLLLSVGDTDTVGFFSYSITVATCKVFTGLVEIVANVESDTYTKVNTNLDATVSSRLPTATYVAPDNATITTLNTKLGVPAVSVSADIAAVSTIVTTLQKIETGRWKIHTSGLDANRIVLYEVDGVTPLYKFDLKDSAGAATFNSPFERVLVP
jgi:hypothetical protein